MHAGAGADDEKRRGRARCALDAGSSHRRHPRQVIRHGQGGARLRWLFGAREMMQAASMMHGRHPGGAQRLLNYEVRPSAAIARMPSAPVSVVRAQMCGESAPRVECQVAEGRDGHLLLTREHFDLRHAPEVPRTPCSR